MARSPKPLGSYEVGYRKPPKQHQFKPNQSGNPTCKRKRDMTLDEIIMREGRGMISVKVGGDTVKMAKTVALVRKLYVLGIGGDVAAARLIFNQQMVAEAREAGEPLPEFPLTPEELAVLALVADTDGKKPS